MIATLTPTRPRRPKAAPTPAYLQRIQRLLRTLGYHPSGIQDILEHVQAHGTVECCPTVIEADRPYVEELLPESTAWSQSRWDRLSWSIGPAPAVAG